MIWLKRLFIPLLLAAPLVATLELGTPATIELVPLAWLSAAFLALCSSIVALSLIGARLPGGVLLQALAGLAYGAVFAFHLREVSAFPPSTVGLAICALLVGVLATVLLRLLCGRRRRVAPLNRAEQTMPDAITVGWRWLMITAVLAVALPLGLNIAGGQLRWHLLHHAKVFGSPVTLLVGKSPGVIEEEDLATKAVSGEQAALNIAHRFAPGATPFQASPEAPSIVFVMLDTLRSDALQAFGGSTNRMPKLASTFRQCQRFTDLLANSSWTRPSIASMHTGLLPEHHGARGVRDPLATTHETFVEVLQRAGYETAALVTNPTAGSSSGLDQGFDTFLEFDRSPYARAEVVNTAALQFLDERSKTPQETAAPLFLYLHYLDPHEPYLAGVEPNGWSASSYHDAYNAELSYLDQSLDAVLPEIRDRLGAGTLFFFVSDHGEEFFEHDLFGHGHTLHREVVNIPAALCGGPFADGDVTARLEGRDVFSLMLSLANGSLRANTDLLRWAQSHHRITRSLSLSFQGFGNLQLRPYLQSIYQRALETKNGKWIHNAYGNTWEFYASSDQDELHNLAHRKLDPPIDEINQRAPVPWYHPNPISSEDLKKGQLKDLGYLN